MNELQTKQCQSCQGEFIIESADFAFYEKIDVPPPTWCPDCRAQRRMAWRNEWHLFRKKEAGTGELVFSAFSPDSSVQIYRNERWASDEWDATDYGRAYDFAKPFFTQFAELLAAVPIQSRSTVNVENSPYCISCAWVKNCYLVAVSAKTEDSAYLIYDSGSRNCFDCYMTENCELCYEGVNLSGCYRTFFSVNCQNSRDVYFSRDLVGCSDCFGSVNLRNKQYYIWNQPHTKEAYEAKLRSFNLASAQSLQMLKQEAQQFWLRHPNSSVIGMGNEHSSGEYLQHSKGAQDCYSARGLEDCKYCQIAPSGPCLECMDCSGLATGAELCYESIGVVSGNYGGKFMWRCRESVRNLQYSFLCERSANLFGCVSLKNQRFCILNKQYTESEYHQLLPKIIQQMKDMPYVDANGREYRYGEYFPAELSPIEYNISLAQEHFPLTEPDAKQAGYRWYQRPSQTAEIEIPSSDLPDALGTADEPLAGKVIECEHRGDCGEECTGAFTVIAQELAFLLEQGLALPRLCFSCRHHKRRTLRRGMKLFERSCQCSGAKSTKGEYDNQNQHSSHSANEPCPNQFETSFAPNRPEIVYCESCYQAEVV